MSTYTVCHGLKLHFSALDNEGGRFGWRRFIVWQIGHWWSMYSRRSLGGRPRALILLFLLNLMRVRRSMWPNLACSCWTLEGGYLRKIWLRNFSVIPFRLFFKGAADEEDWHLPLSVTSESIERCVETRRFFLLVPFTIGFLKAILSFNPLLSLDLRPRAGKAWALMCSSSFEEYSNLPSSTA